MIKNVFITTIILCWLLPARAQMTNERFTGYEKNKILFSEDFSGNLGDWKPEIESPGKVFINENGQMEIYSALGSTVWYKYELEGPVMIEYEATVIDQGDSVDRVSDLNCFWMARDPRSPENIFESAHLRSGQFPDYHTLKTYYTGYGGWNNKRARFRRYLGNGERPLLPKHDLESESFIKPNHTYKIQLVAYHNYIQYIIDGKILFELVDPIPYRSGWFAIRTVRNHMSIDNLIIYSLK